MIAEKFCEKKYFCGTKIKGGGDHILLLQSLHDKYLEAGFASSLLKLDYLGFIFMEYEWLKVER